MIAFGHPDNVLTLSKSLSESIDFNLIFFASGNLYEEGVLSVPLKNLEFGLNSYKQSFHILPYNIQKYLGNDFKIRFFRSYDRKLLKDKKIRNLRKIISAVKIIRKENYDIIHYNGISGFMIYLILFLRKFRKIWTLHDYIPHTGEENKRSFRFMKLLIRFDLYHIQHYRYLQNQLIKFYHLPEEKVKYIPTGPLTIFNSFEPEFLLPSSEKYILFFGRISKYKGIDYLIAAFQKIKKDFPNIKLVIAGRGELWFEPENNENVFFFNRYIKTSELVGLITNSMFVVVPYIDATHSAVVATSYTFLKPIIATDVGGLSEIIKDGLTGFLVPGENINLLALKIKQLISNTSLLRQMKKNIQSITTNGEYSWNNITRKMEELYISVLSKV